MSALIVTKESFSKMKKRFKDVLQTTHGVSVKLSDCAQQLAVVFGFENEHELQTKLATPASDISSQNTSPTTDSAAFDAHFRQKIDVYADKHPALLVRQLASRLRKAWEGEEFVEMKMVLDANQYARLVKKYPTGFDFANEKEFRAFEIMAFLSASESLEDVLAGAETRKEVMVAIPKASVIEMASCSLAGDTPSPFKVFWKNNNSAATNGAARLPDESAELKAIVEDASNWLKSNPTKIKALFLLNSPEFGLSLNINAKDAKYDEVSGFGLFFCEDVSKYFDKELARLDVSVSDIEFLKELAKRLNLLGASTRNRLVTAIDLQLEFFNDTSPTKEAVYSIFEAK